MAKKSKSRREKVPSITGKTRLDLLLRYGFFPKELPFGFTSEILADNFSDLVAVPNIPDGNDSFLPCNHSFSKHGLNRRLLSIVNPKPFAGAAQVISNNWQRFESILSSSIALSKPEFFLSDGYRRSALRNNGESRLVERVRIRTNSRFILEADVTRFFPSIYTHSIAWAIEGKQIAKTNRDPGLVGNQLDKWIQSGQNKQTVGIPIGNDISVIVSEAILAEVDKISNLSTEKSIRWVDDYEVCAETMQQAEESLANLLSGLRSYELDVNDRKTRILQLPLPYEDDWIPILRRFEIRTGKPQIQDLVSYFDLAFEYHRRDSSRHALKFAVGRILNDELVAGDSWETLQRLVMQSLLADPGVLPYIGLLLKRYLKKTDFKLNKILVGDSLNLQLRASLRNFHDSEIAWSIWTLTNLGLELREDTFPDFEHLNDSVSAILFLHAVDQGTVKRECDLSFLTRHFPDPRNPPRGGGMQGNMWLFLYESHVQGWLKTLKTKRCDGNWEDFFKSMLEKQVSFFSPDATDSSVNSEILSIDQKILGYQSAESPNRVSAIEEFSDL
jgi:hypothetical protein